MTWALAQAPTPAAPAATSGSLAFVSNVAANNLLVAAFSIETTGNFAAINPANVTDTVSTPFQQGVWQTNGANRKSTTGIYWGIAPASGANTISFSGAPASVTFLWTAEFSGGVPPGLITAVAAGTGDFAASASINQPSITVPGNVGDCLLLYAIDPTNTVTVTSPWTQASTRSGAPLAYYAPGKTGAFTPSGTQTSGTYAISVLALAPAPIIEPGRDFAAGSRFGPF